MPPDAYTSTMVLDPVLLDFSLLILICKISVSSVPIMIDLSLMSSCNNVKDGSNEFTFLQSSSWILKDPMKAVVATVQISSLSGFGRLEILSSVFSNFMMVGVIGSLVGLSPLFLSILSICFFPSSI